MLSQLSEFHFLWLNSILLYIYYNFPIYTTMGTYIFHVLTCK